MRVELVDLLHKRKIHLPSSFLRLESKCDGCIRIEVTGYPWWQENPQPDNRANITLYFEGITGANLTADAFHADEFDEDLEHFDVRPLSEYPWASGALCKVYCNKPLSNPLDVYVGLHDFLISVGCPYGPERYLNMGDSRSFDEFSAITSSNSFLLYSGPEGASKSVCEELKECNADFNVLKSEAHSRDLIYVQLSSSYLICESAYAIFEG